MRRTLMGLIVAIGGCFSGAVRADMPWPLHPQIPGTLDPATGRFTPDAPSSSGGDTSLRGQLNIVFNLDAAHVQSTSVECIPAVVYYFEIPPGTNRYPVGAGRATNFFLGYDSKNKKFVGTLPEDFDLVAPLSGNFVAEISISCYYTSNPGTPIFTQKLKVPLDEATLVPVNGVMDGRNFR